MDYQALADKSIRGECLTPEECRAVLRSPDADILDLLAAAYRVRREFWGNRVLIQVLMNAKSGLCAEDCGYCSQSKESKAEIPKYPMVSEETLLEGARQAKAANSRRYCIVTSGRSATWGEINFLAGVVRRIVSEVGVSVCCCLGLLSEDKARVLKEAGVEQLNHNLSASEHFYPEVCSTHTYDDRLATLSAAKNAGLGLCSGTIFGMGESEDDIFEVLTALRELDPTSIPINFLHPIPGTPLEDVNYLTPYRCLRILCLARFLIPSREIRIAAGREFHLRSLEAMSLYPANSLFVDGYLTTEGESADVVHQMIRDLGFEVDAGESSTVLHAGSLGEAVDTAPAPAGGS